MVEEVKVALRYAAEPLTLSVDDKVFLPIESTDDTDGESTNYNGTIKWLGILPTISEKQKFAGVKTEEKISSSFCDGAYGGRRYFICPQGHGVFLPVEYVVRHSNKTIKETIAPAYFMNSRPHGIALVISLENDNIDSKHFEETFKYLQYSVQHHTITSISEMMKLVEDIDHTNYDSFVCCISSGGINYHANEIEEADVYKLVNKVEQCPSLNGKPKLMFIQCSRVDSSHTLYNIGPDVFIAWSSLKGKASHCDSKGGSHFVKGLKKIFKCYNYANDINLEVMMEKVSAIVSMNLSSQTDTVGQCCAVESKLKNKVFFLSNFDYSRLLDRAHEGYVTVKCTKITLSGPPGAGKSSVMNLLFGLSFPATTSSKLRPIETTCLMSAREPPKSWNKVDYESLKAKIAQAMKEEHLSHSHMLRAVEGRSSETLKQNNKPSIKSMPHSPSIKDISQLLPTVKKSNELYRAHWIYVVNSGGQAAFLDIAPALLRYNSVNIFPLKLNKKLKEDKSGFYFKVKEKLISEPDERQMTHLQLIKTSFCSLTSTVRDPTDLPWPYVKCPDKISYCLVLGIYLDRISESCETIDDKDKILRKELEQYSEMRLDYRDFEDKIIYPINAIARGDNEAKMASEIRNRICESYIEAKIPARWFLFKLDLDHFQKTTKNMIVSKDDCLKIGAALKMDCGDVEAALVYYHDLTIFLYFPDVLSNVVFLHPQPLFDKLSELISISFVEAVKHLREKNVYLPSGAHKKMKTEGKFKRELLNHLSDGFTSTFTADNFLKLMEHIFILAQINNDEYFLPIALPATVKTKSLTDPYEVYTDPLILTWNKRPLPPGLFSALAVNLLCRQSSPSFELLKPSKDLSQYRNAIQLECFGPGGAVLLVDATYWLEIYYSDKSTKCPVILNAVEEGINKVVEHSQYNNLIKLQPQKCFLCTICSTKDHLCRLNEDNESLSCGSSSKDIDKARQLPWLKKKPNQDILKKEPDTYHLLESLAEIEHLWQKIGRALRVKDHIIEGLHTDGTRDDQSKLSKVLQEWKDSKCSDVTWANVIDALERPIVNNRRIADNVRKYLSI